MAWLVAVLVALDAVVLAIVLTAQLRRRGAVPPVPEHGDVFVAPRPAGVRGRERWLLSIEILDPGEVAARRRRGLGIVGALAPGLVRRVVYDQTRKTVARELAAQGVRADVRLHTLRPAAPGEAQRDVIEAVPVDAPPPLDL